MPSGERARLLRHQRHEPQPPRHPVRQQWAGRHGQPGGDRELEASAWPASTSSRRPSGSPTSPANRTYSRPRSSGPTDFLAGRASRGQDQAPVTSEEPTPVDLGLDPPAPGDGGPRTRPARRWIARCAGLFLTRRRRSPAPSRARAPRPVRIPRDDATRESTRPSPASTPAARGPGTPAGSSAPPSTASGPPGRWSPAMPGREAADRSGLADRGSGRGPPPPRPSRSRGCNPGRARKGWRPGAA